MKKLENLVIITAAIKAAMSTTSWAVSYRLMDAVDALEKDLFETGAKDGYNWATTAQVHHGGWKIFGRCGYGSLGEVISEGCTFRLDLRTCGGHSLTISGYDGRITSVTPDIKESCQSWGDCLNPDDFQNDVDYDKAKAAQNLAADRRAEFMARLGEVNA